MSYVKNSIATHMPCPHPDCHERLFFQCVKNEDTLRICRCGDYWIKIRWVKDDPHWLLHSDTGIYYGFVYKKVIK